MYGNRGCLHDATGRIHRRFNGARWIACRLQFRGAFVLFDGEPHLVLGGNLLRWTPSGYAARRPRPARRRAQVLTPPSLVAVLRAGWEPLVPFLHPTAQRTGE